MFFCKAGLEGKLPVKYFFILLAVGELLQFQKIV